jgi:hypothetical protein
MNHITMKKAFIFLLVILTSGSSVFAQFGISTDSSFVPNNSAMLDVSSQNKGILIPRMTFAERDAISNPADGLMIYCTNCGTNGSLSIYSNNAWRTFAPCSNTTPTSGTHIPANTSIIWNWSSVPDAIGYKWSTSANGTNFIDMQGSTSKTETGLICGTQYTRYVWAYNSCGVSTPLVMTQSTLGTTAPPVAGTHVPGFSSIIWNWVSVTGAEGYKWNTTNNYSEAVDLGTSTSYTESNLNCATAYTRYVWTYSSCGVSQPVILTSNTLPAPLPPSAGTHVPTYTTIVWNWNTVEGAAGYKWNTSDNYSTATDMGTATTNTETNLVCGTNYTRYVWAYNTCGSSTSGILTQATSACYICGDPITINHLASGGVAPVDKTVTYETVTNVPGEPTKCWIARNLGASNQATAVSDATEAAAGWYWQFNRKQGYKHDGTTRTPNTTWITSINEALSWQAVNDPCTLELGNGWRVPTNTEWTNVDGTSGGNWTNWYGPYQSLLIIHAAGAISTSGNLQYRGSNGFYWSSVNTTGLNTMAYQFVFTSTSSMVTNNGAKAQANSIRCIKN